MSELRLVGVPEMVWRVGFDDAWAWTPWEYATDGRFSGRWDDVDGVYRVLYAGSSLLACLVEVLAVFRSDPELARA
ncbi:MAG: RES domain-containing protein, partial [Acidimicrobiales bacterium]